MAELQAGASDLPAGAMDTVVILRGALQSESALQMLYIYDLDGGIDLGSTGRKLVPTAASTLPLEIVQLLLDAGLDFSAELDTGMVAWDTDSWSVPKRDRLAPQFRQLIVKRIKRRFQRAKELFITEQRIITKGYGRVIDPNS